MQIQNATDTSTVNGKATIEAKEAPIVKVAPLAPDAPLSDAEIAAYDAAVKLASAVPRTMGDVKREAAREGKRLRTAMIRAACRSPR